MGTHRRESTRTRTGRCTMRSFRRAVELGVVGERGLRPDQNGIRAGAQPVHGGPRSGTGDPARFSRCRRDPPVQGARELEARERPSPLADREKSAVQEATLFLQHADRDLRPSAAQPAHPATRHFSVWIGVTDEHSAQARPGDRLRARARTPDVAAGLQGHGHRRAAHRPRTEAAHGVANRHRLRVRSTDGPGGSPTQNLVAAKHDGAHGRIRKGPPESAAPQGECHPHGRFSFHDPRLSSRIRWMRRRPCNPRHPGSSGTPKRSEPPPGDRDSRARPSCVRR